MAFPTRTAGPVTTTTTDSATHPVGVPGGTGGLLLGFAAFVGVQPYNVTALPWGAAALAEGNRDVIKLFAFAKRAEGTEANSTLATDAAVTAVIRVFRVGGAHAASAPEVGVPVIETTLQPNPPSLAASWGAEDNLFFAVEAHRTAATAISSYPANYSPEYASVGGDASLAGGGSNHVMLGLSSRELAAAGDDPGVFQLSGTTTRPAVSLTIAIRPAGADATPPAPPAGLTATLPAPG